MKKNQPRTEPTPGPWKVDGGLRTRCGGPRVIHATEPWGIADCWDMGTEEETNANARLIASAPALLAVVAELAETPMTCETPGVARDDTWDDLIGKARAVQEEITE